MMMRIGKRQRLNTTIQTQQIQNNNELPEEIMHDILSRLPVKSLSQCRYVCKNWYNLINDPDFIKLHHSRISIYGSAGLVALADHQITFVDTLQIFNLVDNNQSPPCFNAFNIHFNLPEQKSHIIQPLSIVGSANGLMCMCLLPRQKDFFICNPVTTEVLQLPRAPGLGPYCQKYNLEYLCPISSGFGFHAATNTYKVVRTWYFCPEGSNDLPQLQIGIEIYTLGSGVWRWIHVDISSMTSFMQVSYVFLNEALHWQMKDVRNSERSIGVLDIGDENFRTFGMPIEEDGIETRNLTSLRHCLCLIDEFNDRNIIWIMKQYGAAQSWAKEQVISKQVFGSLPTMSIQTLTTMKNGSVLLHGDMYQGYYDFEKEEFNQISVYGIRSPPYKLKIVAHIGSLISPRSITCTSDVSQVSSTKPRRPVGFKLQKNATKKQQGDSSNFTTIRAFFLNHGHKLGDY